MENAKKRVEDIKKLMTKREIWSDQDKVKKLGKESSRLKDFIEIYENLEEIYNEISVILELYEEDKEPDLKEEAEKKVKLLKKKVDKVEIKSLLTGENDDNNAYLEIHPGAGGTESHDWASILYRMYKKWVDNNDYKMEIVDYQAGEEAGIKSVTIKVIGKYAYGYLKSENGVHRLVRISPFDANKRRHTSFASVFVYPEIEKDIDVDINEKDLRIDTYRASGAGGQHVNVTDSAVRITHQPTGIVVQCQNERSQMQNKKQAMKILKARLYQKELEKKEEERKKLENNKMDNAWGSQIRSYVLHPYQKIKDHRTDVDIGNVDSVLNGNLDKFMEEYLRQKKLD
ncbi:MAG TPA: peptide chain release factor 2 [Candidatus Mcinerneyibacterium sp.]|nr:peptide chain release factor 2 [Candidatus Mcinerneyibacterium sp.]